MKVYVLAYEYESWTESAKEILGIYLTKASAYDSLLKEAKDRNWKDNGDERYYKLTDDYLMYRYDWEMVRTLQIEEYEAKN